MKAEEPVAGHSRGRARLAVLAALAPILAVTLVPAGYSSRVLPSTCLFCGAHGGADAVLNLLLFVPLGLALAFAGLRPLRAVRNALALSLLIEAIQLIVITRYSSMGDVLWNTVGAAAGVLLWRAWPRLRPDPDDTGGKSLAAFGLTTLLAAGGAVLFSPNPPGGIWYIHWLRNTPGLERYRGQVLSAEVGGRSLVPWFEVNPGPAREALRVRAPITVTLILGPAPEREAALLTVIHERRDVVYLGATRTGLLAREFRTASGLKLHTPTTRVDGVFGSTRPGDTVQVTLSGAGRSRCLTVRERTACGLDLPLARAWSLLVESDWMPAPLLPAGDVAWMALVFAPVGFWSSRRRLLAIAGAALAATFIMVPLIWSAVYAELPGVVGAVVGIAAGAVLRTFPRVLKDALGQERP